MQALKIGLVLQPYTGAMPPHEYSIGPELIYEKALKVLEEEKVKVASIQSVSLTSKESREYGEWHRMGLANGHLGRSVAPMSKKGLFVLGLLGNCNSLSGMLAGLQNSGASQKPLTVGLVWLDAHGDFNTPETTLSGWLGGMPVAVAAGKCLHRLRKKSGLDPPISTKNIIMMGQRDIDPLEQELINNASISMISVKSMITQNKSLKDSMARLSNQVHKIYVHIDLDVLDASSIPGSHFKVPGGLTPLQLSRTLRTITGFEKVKALGLSSFPTPEYGRKKAMDSTLELIRGTIQGLKDRHSL
jgi:arginase